MVDRYELTTIRTELADGGTVIATLNRPERLNALTHEMWSDLERLVDLVADDDESRVLVITGSGRGFCAGADLDFIDQAPRMSVMEFLRDQEFGAGVIARLRHLLKPVIAAVNGPAAGGGLAIALAADVRLASPLAKFNVAFVRLGLSGCDVGVSWLLPRVVGLGHASELMLSGRLIDAAEAHRIGLINHVSSAEELLKDSLGLAAEFAANSPFALRLTKQVLQLNVDAPSMEAAIELENRNQVLASRTDDMAEAVAAFRQRRAARFRARLAVSTTVGTQCQSCRRLRPCLGPSAARGGGRAVVSVMFACGSTCQRLAANFHADRYCLPGGFDDTENQAHPWHRRHQATRPSTGRGERSPADPRRHGRG